MPVAKLQLQMAGQNDLQIGNAVGHLLVARKIPNALSKIKIGDEGPFILSQLTCEPITSMIVVKSVLKLKHKTSESASEFLNWEGQGGCLGLPLARDIPFSALHKILKFFFIYLLRKSFVPTLL